MLHFNLCFILDSPRAPSARGFAPLSQERGETSASGRWGEYALNTKINSSHYLIRAQS